MAYLKNLKKIGVNTTVLTTSLALAACGGGGGYYGNNDSSNNNENNTGGNQSETDTSKVADSLNIALQDAEGGNLQIAQDNSQIKVAVKVLNADKGGVAGKDVRLSITDSDKLGVESTNSKVTSDENGIALFTLNIPALKAETGKVQLTAVIDGTTISIPYTLNIKKTSTIVSDYNINVPQGKFINLPKGSVELPVQITDTNGGAKAGQTVELTLPQAMQGKFFIVSGSSLSTDAEGKASFKIEANPDLSVTEISEFVASSHTLNFKLIDENRAEKQTTTALTFKDISKVVNVLVVDIPDTSINAKAGTAKVRVFAKNSNGDILANTKVKLEVEAIAASYGVSLDKAEATTNAQGYAEFTLTSNATHPITLAQRGIALTATYTENNQNIKGNATVQVITADKTVDNQEAIQRLEIASSYKVNAVNDNVEIKVKAINFKGLGATTGKVSISLNAEAQSNGVTFDGAATQDVDANGFVAFKLKTNAKTAKAIEALVAAGIVATFTSDNGMSNKIEIAVENEAVSEEAVSYLQIDPILASFDSTQDQTITVKVKAVGVKGSALISEKIVFKPSAQFTTLGLSLNGQAERQTDENGYVTYTLAYKYNGSQAQQDTAKDGVILTVASVADSTKTQSTKINFVGDKNKVALDYFTVDTAGSKEIATNSNTDIVVDVNLFGVDGETLSGQDISIGIDDTSTSNGVSYATATKVTSINGKAQFKLKVNAANATQLATLIEKGLTIALVAIRDDGSKYTVTRKIELAAVTGGAVTSQVNYLLIDPILTRLDYSQDQKISVKVKAIASDGSALANEAISIEPNAAFAKLHLSLNGSAQRVTDASGYAIFEYDYKYAEATEQKNLPTTGVEFVAKSANGKTQPLKLNFKSPTESSTLVDLDNFAVSTDGQVILNASNVAQTKISVVATDTKGQKLQNQNISIALGIEANNGVSADLLVKPTDATGKAEFNLALNPENAAEIQNLVANGLTVTITSTRKDGSVYTVVRKIVVQTQALASQVSYLAVDPISTVFDYTQDQTITVKAKALAEDGSVLANQNVSISQLTSELAQKIGLTLKSLATQITDALGYATFEFDYKFADTTEQQNLPATGIDLTVSSNGKSQPVRLNFKAPVVQQTLDYFTLTPSKYAVELDGTAQVITVSVDAKDTKGKVLVGQTVGIGLNEAALPNGIKLLTPSATVTDNTGKATFQISIDPKTESQIDNLDANDLTISVVGKRSDGSQYSAVQKIELSKPAVVLQDLANLEITSVNPTLSVLGGETRVKVVARDAAGHAIPNTPISVALSSLVSSRVLLSDVPATTNSKGEAEFTVTVSEGKYDESLIKNGIIFAVVGTNLNNGDRLQQTSSIGITAPANALNPRLTADVNSVTAGQTVKVYASVKDEMGLNTAAGTPMRLSLNSEAVTVGVKLASEAVMVQANGSVAVDLIVPKGISSGTLNSIVITGTIRDPRGNEIPTNLTFTVKDAINPYHLTIDSNRVSLSSAGDTALVTVKLLDANQGGVANQPVTLSIADPRVATSIKGSSQIVTNAFGEAVFELSMKAVAGLVAPIPNIVLSATNTNENGVVVSQTSQLQVHTPTALAPQLDLKIKASKDKLHVRGDAVEVSVLVTDVNGSSQSGKAVTLTIPNYRNNGAYIRGASTIESDENGWAKFTVVVDEGLRGSGYTAAQFVSDDLNIEAVVKDAQNTERRQSYLMDIVSADVPVTQGAITVVMNPNKVGTDDSTGIYYNWNASVQVTDLDGRPVANQKVTMDIRATEFVRGQWVVLTDPVTNEKYWSQQHLNNPPAYSPLSCAVPTIDDPSTPYDDTKVTITDDVDSNGTSVKEALNVVRFIGASEANPYTATYTTDKEGKFDFELRYPKTYGGWLSVQVGASTSMSSYPLHGYRTVMLPTVANDFDKSNWAFTPSIDNQSPYGKKLNVCK